MGTSKAFFVFFPHHWFMENVDGGWGSGGHTPQSLNIKMDTQCERNNMHSYHGFMERWSGREGRQKRNISTCILLTSK
jgi:hypothetical protein